MRFKFSILSILLTLVFGISIMQPAVSSEGKEEDTSNRSTPAVKITLEGFLEGGILHGIDLFEQGELKASAEVFRLHRGVPIVYPYLDYLSTQGLADGAHKTTPALDAAALGTTYGSRRVKEQFDASIGVYQARRQARNANNRQRCREARARHRTVREGRAHAGGVDEALDALITQAGAGSSPAAYALVRLSREQGFAAGLNDCLYENATATGDLRAIAMIAKLKPKQRFGKQQITIVAALYESLKLTCSNEGEGYLKLAKIYGSAKIKDIEASAKCYEMAALLGNLEALEICSEQGTLDKKALFWSLQLADRGSPYGCSRAGTLFNSLSDGTENQKKSFFYHSQAVKLAKNSGSECNEDLLCYLANLGNAYRLGRGTAPDPKKVKQCLVERLELGDRTPEAVGHMGSILLGEGDHAAALGWLYHSGKLT